MRMNKVADQQTVKCRKKALSTLAGWALCTPTVANICNVQQTVRLCLHVKLNTRMQLASLSYVLLRKHTPVLRFAINF